MGKNPLAERMAEKKQTANDVAGVTAENTNGQRRELKHELKKITASKAELEKRFDLLSKLVASPESLTQDEEIYQQLVKLIRSDFLRLCANIGIPGESALYNDLLILLGDLRDLMEFPYLANKNILAVGGGFSAGKSRFINSILGKDQFLPEGNLPTTAIPTYLTTADKEEIRALNTFNRLQELNHDELQSISHVFNTGQNVKNIKISFCHILKQIEIRTPHFKWSNIALLDTPGYSKPSAENQAVQEGMDAGNTDEEKAREHLSLADHLLWVISVHDGTFQQSDIAFLHDKVKWERPIYILINRCDDKPLNQVKQVFERVEEDVQEAGFKLAGISAYSAAKAKVYCGDDPKTWFNEIDGKRKLTHWRKRFKAIFEKIIHSNAEAEEQLKVLNNSLKPVFMKDDLLKPEQRNALQTTMREMERKCKVQEEAKKQFINFNEKVENLVEKLLKQINVQDETASDVGIKGEFRAKTPDELLGKNKDDIFEGVVKRLMKAMGFCYIECDAFKDLIRIKYPELLSHYTEPDKYFAVGKKVSLKLYDIDMKNEKITFTVTPK